MEDVAVVGLGSMGLGVAENLLRQGWPVHVLDISQERMRQAEEKGAKSVRDYAELAGVCRKIILLLPMAPWDPTLERVVLGEDGLLPHLRPGSTLIDCGNTSPVLCRELAAKLQPHDVSFVDAPISGGPQGASAGTVTIMVGASEQTLAECAALFEAMGQSTERFGDVGSGQMAKLANNILCAANLAALSEVLVFADRVGLDVVQLVDLVSRSSGGSWVVDNYGRGIVGRERRGEPTPGGGWDGVREGGRDRQLSWALQIADDLQIPMNMTNMTHAMFLMARGNGKRGLFEPIVEMLEDMTGADARKKSAGAVPAAKSDSRKPGRRQ